MCHFMFRFFIFTFNAFFVNSFYVLTGLILCSSFHFYLIAILIHFCGYFIFALRDISATELFCACAENSPPPRIRSFSSSYLYFIHQKESNLSMILRFHTPQFNKLKFWKNSFLNYKTKNLYFFNIQWN